jgi:hypothetical protein
MLNITDRIGVLSAQLLAIARLRAEDTLDAYGIAHVALLRLLDEDPELKAYPQILASLQRQSARLH